MTVKKKTIPIGFAFVDDGKDWQGGANYFRSLFLALESQPESALRPVAFVGAGVDPAKYGYPASVRFVHDRAFNRGSLKWLLDRLASKFFGVSWLTNRVMRRHGVDVLSHSPATGDRALRSIGWVPDFQHMHLPQFFSPEELERRTQAYRQLLSDSDLIVVSSESARRDLEQFAPQHAAKARVLRFCALPPTLSSEAFDDIAALYGLDGPYFYIPNQVWAHKNHLTAVRALAMLRDEYPALKIICSGGLNDYRNPDHLAALRAEIDRLGLVERFVLLGPIPYAHIAHLMMHSIAVINPSLFEGWSTTVEEAKALGVPMILSGIDVHREQCDRGQATFFDTLDHADLAARMQQKLGQAPATVDHDAARAEHRARAQEFALAYERIVNELVARA